MLEKKTDKYHEFGLPGGKLEIGESIKQGVVREVMEEIGIEVLIKILSLDALLTEKSQILKKYILSFKRKNTKAKHITKSCTKIFQQIGII